MEKEKDGPIATARTPPRPVGLRQLLAALALILAVTTGAAHFIERPILRDGIAFSVRSRDENGRWALEPARDGRYRVWRPLRDISPLMIEATELELGPRSQTRRALARRLAALRGDGAAGLRGRLAREARALWLARAFDKNELLEAYLNLAPYGAQISGVEAASFVYFDKHADQLTLSEALTLSVLPDRPLRLTLAGANPADQAVRRQARRRLRQRVERERQASAAAKAQAS